MNYKENGDSKSKKVLFPLRYSDVGGTVVLQCYVNSDGDDYFIKSNDETYISKEDLIYSLLY
jgi:hypothetical protein